MRVLALTPAALAAAMMLGGCSTFGVPPGSGPGGGDLIETVRAMSARCTGAFNANLTFAPPLPPSGSLVVNQTCAAPPADKPAPSVATGAG